MKKKIAKFFEYILFKSRFFIVLAVLGLAISSIFTFIWTFINFTLFSLNDLTDKKLIVQLITSVDLFLIWIITLIVSFSLYEIYLKSDNTTVKLPKAFIVNNLYDLKEKLTSVILIILIITYFQYSIELTYKDSYELLAFAFGIFLISLSIYFSKKK